MYLMIYRGIVHGTFFRFLLRYSFQPTSGQMGDCRRLKGLTKRGKGFAYARYFRECSGYDLFGS